MCPRSSEPSGTSSRIVYCTGSTLPTSPCTATNSRIARTSSSVAHGVNGSHDGRISMPCVRSSSTASAGLGRGVALVEQLERRVVDRLERGDDEDAAGRGELCPDVGVREDVLDLDRAVEGQVREPLVHRAHDPERVVDAVEEVRVAVGHVAGAQRDLLRDVGDDRVDVVDPDATVVDDRDRAVPAPVRAARVTPRPTRRGAPHRACTRCAYRSSGGSRSRAGSAGAIDRERRVVLDPAQERGVRVAADERGRDVGAHRGVRARSRRRARRSSARPRGRGGPRCASGPRARPCRPRRRGPDPTCRSRDRGTERRGPGPAAARPGPRPRAAGGRARRSRRAAPSRDDHIDARAPLPAARPRPRPGSRPGRTGIRGSGRRRGGA